MKFKPVRSKRITILFGVASGLLLIAVTLSSSRSGIRAPVVTPPDIDVPLQIHAAEKITVTTQTLFLKCGHVETEQEEVIKDADTNSTRQIELDAYCGHHFLIQSEGEQVRVYRLSSGALIEELDTRLSSLPQTEVAKIKNGIEVYGEQALEKMLEDYSS